MEKNIVRLMDNIVVLNDEHGNEVEFEYLDLIEHNNEAYVVLLPVEDDTDEVVILRCEESDDDSDEENYRSVDDQELLNEIFEIFKEKNKDNFDNSKCCGCNAYAEVKPEKTCSSARLWKA